MITFLVLKYNSGYSMKNDRTQARINKGKPNRENCTRSADQRTWWLGLDDSSKDGGMCGESLEIFRQ